MREGASYEPLVMGTASTRYPGSLLGRKWLKITFARKNRPKRKKVKGGIQ